jgi:hypothetical protein
MKKIIVLMILTIGFSQEFEVDGDLKVTGNIIFSDSTVQNTVATPTPGINGVAEFTSSTTWNVPSDITKVRIQMIGGGEGGASNGLYGGAACGTTGKGGSAGGYVHTVVPVIPGETLTIVVGSGGAAASVANTYGDSGGNSSITNQAGSVLAISYGGGNSSSGLINDGIGFIRDGEIIYGNNGNPGQANSIDFGFGYGNGGSGSTCGGNVVQSPPEDGISGYLLMNW